MDYESIEAEHGKRSPKRIECSVGNTSGKNSWVSLRLVGSSAKVPVTAVILGRLMVIVVLAFSLSLRELLRPGPGTAMVITLLVATIAQVPAIVSAYTMRKANLWLSLTLLFDIPILFYMFAATGSHESPFLPLAACWVVFGIIAFPIWQAIPYGLLILGLLVAQTVPLFTGLIGSHEGQYNPLPCAYIVSVVSTAVVIILSLFLASQSAIKRTLGLELASLLDPMTTLANRRAFDSCLNACAQSAEQSGQDFFLAIIDVDSLKAINDDFGHQEGDLALRTVARSISEIGYASYAFRLGGDEFALIFCNDNSELITVRLANLDLTVKSAVLPSFAVTVSIGLAKGRDMNIIRLADQALYKAKRSGRNQIVVYEDGKVPN